MLIAIQERQIPLRATSNRNNKVLLPKLLISRHLGIWAQVLLTQPRNWCRLRNFIICKLPHSPKAPLAKTRCRKTKMRKTSQSSRPTKRNCQPTNYLDKKKLLSSRCSKLTTTIASSNLQLSKRGSLASLNLSKSSKKYLVRSTRASYLQVPLKTILVRMEAQSTLPWMTHTQLLRRIMIHSQLRLIDWCKTSNQRHTFWRH